MRPIKNILVTTDLTPLSLSAFEEAERFAELTGAKINVLYVGTTFPYITAPTFNTDFDNYHFSIIHAEEEVKKFFMLYNLDKKEYRKIIKIGAPEDEILKVADYENIDLIIMATHGRSGISHLFLGSVTEKIIRHAKVPVITVKPTVKNYEELTQSKEKESIS